MKRPHSLTPRFVLTSLLAIAVGLSSLHASIVQERVLLAPVYKVNKIYKSMMGPSANQSFLIERTDEPELLWLVGLKAEMVDADGETLLSPEFMCHSNIDIDIQAYRHVFRWRKNASQRLFTLSQGQLDVSFPEGFGIPMVSWQPLHLNSQVLNLNAPKLRQKVRHRITVSYIRDRDLTTPMRAMYMAAAQAMVQLEGSSGYYGVADPNESHGETCAVGQPVRGTGNTDVFGNRFSAHWVVPPGRHEYHSLATHWMNLPFDTTAHAIAVHLHPMARSLELIDLTTKETVYRSEATNHEGRLGLAHVESFSDVAGVELYQDHEYQVRAVYENTTDEPQDSMAVFYLYLEDQEFRKPTAEDLASRLENDPFLKSKDWTKAPLRGADALSPAPRGSGSMM